MRYQIFSNWLGVQNGMCYYLVDTETKPPFYNQFLDGKGKTIEWSYNGKELRDKCNEMNKISLIRAI